MEAAAGSSVVLLAGQGIRALTAAGEWRAELGSAAEPAGPGTGTREPAAFRDALVAGLVPGIALAWSWPDMLRHALALAASAAPGGDADLTAYEATLSTVEVTGPRS